ncbi:MAG: DUF1573 domain-containing protein, partial [Calditrichaeota bacterium]|nr:DUF1573 domain-containing protein [Calditrichota bacterium]
MYWLIYEPDEGRLQSGADMDIMVTLNAAGLIEGDYIADLHFLSNDPADPDVAVSITAHVAGAPDLVAEWPAAWGWTVGVDAVLDWNRRYDPNLFTGGPYPMTFTVTNEGTADLVVEGIEPNHDYFTAAPVEFVLGPGEEQVVTVTFNAPRDEPGNYNPTLIIFSNDPSPAEYPIQMHARAFLPPRIVIDPGSIEEDMFTGDVVERTINVANDGDALLAFTIESEIVAEPGDDANGRALRSVDAGPARDRRGGPNQWGYEWRDNLENDGLEYEWIDIRQWEGVQQQVQGDDQINGPFALGWNFPLYDRQYNQYWVCSDGWMSFQRSAYQRAVPDIPGNNDAAWFATILWGDGDWHGGQGLGFPSGPVYMWTNRRDMAVITWNQWYSRYQQPCADVQVILNDKGLIKIQYGLNYGLGGNRFDNGHYGSEAGLIGHGVAQNFQFNAPGAGAGYLVQGRTIACGPSRAFLTWLAYEPDQGRLASGADMDILITLNADGLIEGDYIADLHFLSNDPAEPDVVASVTIHVSGAPNLVVEWPENYGYPRVLNWNARYDPNLFTGGPYAMQVLVTNTGTSLLEVADVATDHEYFTVAPTEFNLEPEGEQVVTVTFNAPANAPDEYEATLTLPSNDPDGDVTVALHALAHRPPTLIVDPQSIEDDLFTGQTAEHTVNLANDGEADLHWTTDAEIIGEPGDDANGRALRNVHNGPVRDRRSAVDDMGYEWRDILEDDGPEYEWVDIRQWQGTRAFNMGDDQNSGAVQLGWEFPFWDRIYRQVFLDTD